MRYNQYIEEMKRFCHENNVDPQFTVYTDNKGQIYIQGCDDLSMAKRLEIMGRAFQTMHGIMEQENRSIKTATPLDMSKLKPIK